MPFASRGLEIKIESEGWDEPLVIPLKDDASSVDNARHFMRMVSKAQGATKQIERLRRRQEEESLTPESFNSIQGEIEEWEKIPDLLSVLIQFVETIGDDSPSRTWNYWADEDAKAEGKALPFTEENIKNLGANVLNKIVEKAVEAMGLKGEDDDEKKASSNSSSPSTQKARAESLSLTGTLN